MEDLGLLIIRIAVGLLIMGHGVQKLFGWFGGYGIKGTGGWLESIGIKPGVSMAVLAGLSELIGGALFATGFCTIIGAALITIVMLAAIIKVHLKNGLWITANGVEYCLVIIAVVVGVAFIGAGEYSFDCILWPEKM